MNYAVVAWNGLGGAPSFSALLPSGAIFDVGGVRYRWNDLIVVVSMVVVLALLPLFLTRGRPGRTVRAVAQDREAAAIVGIDVNKTITAAVGLEGALAGLVNVVEDLGAPSRTPSVTGVGRVMRTRWP